MSQEERDARLGLTGLTGADREARVRLLAEELERKAAAARAALQAQREAPRVSQNAASGLDLPSSDGTPEAS